jgi:hypothetical protein
VNEAAERGEELVAVVVVREGLPHLVLTDLQRNRQDQVKRHEDERNRHFTSHVTTLATIDPPTTTGSATSNALRSRDLTSNLRPIPASLDAARHYSAETSVGL